MIDFIESLIYKIPVQAQRIFRRKQGNLKKNDENTFITWNCDCFSRICWNLNLMHNKIWKNDGSPAETEYR